MAEEFAEKGLPQMDFSRLETGRPVPGMFPTAIAVACTKCHATGTIDLPRNFDHRLADKILNGQIVKAFCGNCRTIAEVRPFKPRELKENALVLIRRYCDNYHELVVNSPDRIESAEKMIREAQTISEDFVRQLRNTLGQDEPFLINAPTPSDPKPLILDP